MVCFNQPLSAIEMCQRTFGNMVPKTGDPFGALQNVPRSAERLRGFGAIFLVSFSPQGYRRCVRFPAVTLAEPPGGEVFGGP